jgi:hypothetical protein
MRYSLGKRVLRLPGDVRQGKGFRGARFCVRSRPGSLGGWLNGLVAQSIEREFAR